MTVTKLKHILRECQHLCAIKILLNLNVDKEMLLSNQHDASAFFSPSPWLGLVMTQAKKLVFRIQLSKNFRERAFMNVILMRHFSNLVQRTSLENLK